MMRVERATMQIGNTTTEVRDVVIEFNEQTMKTVVAVVQHRNQGPVRGRYCVLPPGAVTWEEANAMRMARRRNRPLV